MFSYQCSTYFLLCWFVFDCKVILTLLAGFVFVYFISRSRNSWNKRKCTLQSCGIEEGCLSIGLCVFRLLGRKSRKEGAKKEKFYRQNNKENQRKSFWSNVLHANLSKSSTTYTAYSAIGGRPKFLPH